MTSSEHPFPNVDQLVANNEHYASRTDNSHLASSPQRALAIVACMDARVDVPALLGLENGQAHIIRNAGGIVTDDAIRSLCLSQRALGTREIIVMHHTKCGLHNLDAAGLNAEIEAETGVRPQWSFEGFADPHDDVRQSIRRLQLSPFVAHCDNISGFVYDVDTSRLEPVEL